jgi:hypothetical protein
MCRYVRRRRGVAALAELDLDVPERRVVRVPEVRDPLRPHLLALRGGALGRALVELLDGEIRDRAVGLDVEVAQRHRLHVVQRQSGEREHQRSRERLLARRRLEVLRRRERRAIEPADVRGHAPELDLQRGHLDRLDLANVARGLERERGDLRRVGKRDERARQITAAERIDHGLRRVLRAKLADELLRLARPLLAKAGVEVRHLLAVAGDRSWIQARRQGLAAAARGDAVHRSRLCTEIAARGLGIGSGRDQSAQNQRKPTHRRLHRTTGRAGATVSSRCLPPGRPSPLAATNHRQLTG